MRAGAFPLALLVGLLSSCGGSQEPCIREDTIPVVWRAQNGHIMRVDTMFVSSPCSITITVGGLE